MGAKKNFVLDTNVILHDYKCIENFQENDIYLPIVVLEELDRFKKGSDQINYNAREFVRELDAITTNDLFTKGASLGPNQGMLHVVTGDKYQKRVKEAFSEVNPDHRILSCTLTIAEKHPDMQTILVTKDVNLRMKARSLGIKVEDYITDKVINVDIFEKSQETYEGISPELIDQIYSTPGGVNADLLDINFGCPVKKVAGKGAGAGMLRNIPLLLEITREVVKAVRIPVTVKTRLGWDAENRIIVDLAERLQDCGIAALSIHGRTRAQMYTGEHGALVARI